MTNEQILKKAIEKAMKNGYEPESMWELHLKNWALDRHYYRIAIFSHDFLKAFFGTKMECVQTMCHSDAHERPKVVHERFPESWEYHAEQMVKEEEPLKYLETFL